MTQYSIDLAACRWIYVPDERLLVADVKLEALPSLGRLPEVPTEAPQDVERRTVNN